MNIIRSFSIHKHLLHRWLFSLGIMLLTGLLVVGEDMSAYAARPSEGRKSSHNDQQLKRLPSAVTRDEKRVALVIGNANYTRTYPLTNSVNDAEDMAKALHDLGFDVDLHTDVKDGDAMREAVDGFSHKLRNGDVALFFYAGHGMQVDGENFLIPTKIGADGLNKGIIQYETLAMRYVLEWLDAAGDNIRKVIILDVCRNNSLHREMRKKQHNLVGVGLASMQMTEAVIAFSQCESHEYAQRGTYVKHLLANLATPGIGIMDMFKRVRQGVAEDTRDMQIPWENTSLTKEFCFNGCASDKDLIVPTIQRGN